MHACKTGRLSGARQILQPTCAAQHREQIRAATQTIPTFACFYCGKVVPLKQGKKWRNRAQRCCSRACSFALKRKTTREKPVPTFTCLACGKLTVYQKNARGTYDVA